MRVLRLLHKILSTQFLKIHSKRLTAPLSGVDSLLRGATLTVTALGRGLHSPALTKHNIKRMDRLLSNTRLQSERMGIYEAIAHYLCRCNPRPVILVDWSDLVERERLMLLRAAIAVEGRSIPIYEAVYTLKQYNSPRIHMRFLKELKSLLPEDCSPIVITDAGFRGPWFNAVIERLNLLLLIGALVTLCLWWVGCHALRRRWHRHFQANTVSDRNVLSILFLATAVLRRPDYKINETELIESLRSLPDYVLDRNFA